MSKPSSLDLEVRVRVSGVEVQVKCASPDGGSQPAADES